jgi:hypothetical protein
MHRLVPVVVALLGVWFALVASAATVTGQATTPVASPAAACIAPPPAAATPSASQGSSGTEETGTAAALAPGSEAPLPPLTPPAGTPATTAVLDRIRDAEETLARCFRAGDGDAFIALFTPKAQLAELGLSDPQGTPVHSASLLILREEILSVSDAQTHADGRVSADVVFAFEGQRMRARDIFVKMAGRLLLDEVIGLPLGAGPHGAPAATPAPLDAATLHALAIIGFMPEEEPHLVHINALGDAIDMQPGDARKLALGVFDYEVCGTGIRCFVPVAADASWSVTPADGARIDPATGILSIDPDTPDGRDFSVRAEIEDERHVVETRVHVFIPAANPLIGYWREEAQLACGSGTEVVPAVAIQELIFDPDGAFAVTWLPFESYKDYWGTYTFDLAQGTLALTITGGNTIPPDADGEGRFALDATGQLILTELWLGTPSLESGPAHCGHRFVR